MSALIVKGDIRKLKARRRKRKSSGVNPAFACGVGGIKSAKSGRAGALSTTNTDRTLGASTRQGWRLSVTLEERRAHGSAVTRNNSEYVAYNGVQSATGYSHPLMDGRNNGRKANAK